ncbi:DNA glycosylase AlkZ-like family protein [Cellulomonas edaphi]|uniref:Crosslink repair DNA glycosylase YcaQ family protein n=1 Tax=Cellulomonas edaphi TaxID=3053468 RepID=A0ABT7S2R4_9CELL|nr:crosslink repair DNA glycosylase YcaQ family protein [Cellulomons edaphi]MDM7829898.1 crosslink repair DNA glycosylase YcaQ family protein [Cellulomons edaphi]
MIPLRVTRRQALAWRMRRQLLEPPGTVSVDDVVHRLTALPAQSDVELAVRTRQASSSPGEVERAVRDGRLLRTFAFRGAVHVMTPEHASAYLALRAVGRQWERASWQEYYGLVPDAWPAFRSAVRDALDEGPLSPAEIGEALAAQMEYARLQPIFSTEPWTLLKALAWQGDLVFGPPRDGRATFQRLDRNPRWTGLSDVATAGRHAVTSYVSAYGPATPDHLQYWLGGGLSAGRRRVQGWVDDLHDRLAPVDVEGTAAFVLAQHVDELAATEPTDAVVLLPGYDQWVLGPGTADPDVVPAPHRAVVTRGANLVLAGGAAAGTWSVRGDALSISVFGGRPGQRALDDAVARLARILDRELQPTVLTG